MNDFLGADDEPNIAVALLIKRDAKSMLNSDVSQIYTKANASLLEFDSITYHNVASDDIADTIGPPKLPDVSIFNALNKNGLVTNIHAPRCIKCKLN